MPNRIVVIISPFTIQDLTDQLLQNLSQKTEGPMPSYITNAFQGISSTNQVLRNYPKEMPTTESLFLLPVYFFRRNSI